MAAGLAIACLAGVAGWNLFNFASRAATPVLAQKSDNTADLTAQLERDFGYGSTPSLLYDQSLDNGLLTHAYSASHGKLMPLMPSHEDIALRSRLQQLFDSYGSGFTPHFYYFNSQDGSYVEINGYAPVPAASVIKLPILLDYLLSLDEHDIRMETPLLYTEFHRAAGAGELQYQEPGLVFTANHVAADMIRISDNTCTNMMISYLGGSDAVNRRLAELGLRQTRIRNWLPDLTGTNTISAYEMATILNNIDRGPLISNLTRYNGLNILEQTHNRRLLVNPLPGDVRVAHKTGDIGTSLGDSGIVYLPDGRKYIISVQVERPYNDYTPRDMIQKASRMVYEHVAGQQMPDSSIATRI
ncbi:MAG TPA: serine hydrolase [Coleofasciculaceae cyanobacterium]